MQRDILVIIIMYVNRSNLEQFFIFFISKGTYYSGGPTIRKSGYDERILWILKKYQNNFDNLITCILRLWNHFDNF